VIDALGGSAGVFGYSSGASLALQAAPRLKGLWALAVYESPYIVDDSRAPYPPDYLARTDELIAAGKLGAAIDYFMVTGIGLPRVVPALMRLNPQWRTMKRVAVTLGQDARLVYPYGQGRPLPADSLAGIAIPTWVGWGSKSPEWIRNANQQLARLLVDSQVTTAELDKQTHLVKPRVLAPELIAHFRGTAGPLSSTTPSVPGSMAAQER
jgi:pimeloyl-ACP methyl ester carboxylesterase